VRRAVWIASALVLGLPCTVAADSPAQLVVGERSIEELLRLPGGLPPGRYEVHCGARISAGGFARRRPWCYSLTDSALGNLQSAVAFAVLEAQFVPARRGGHAIDVYAVLMVIVDTRLREPLILAVPNNGTEASRYGLLYTAPQRFDDSYLMDLEQDVHTSGSGAMLAVFNIDADGNVVSCSVRQTARAPKRYIEQVKATMRRMRFLPGYYEGKPVPMELVQPWFWQRRVSFAQNSNSTSDFSYTLLTRSPSQTYASAAPAVGMLTACGLNAAMHSPPSCRTLR
jgi:hypothetical protein